jgi:hypothetical protein
MLVGLCLFAPLAGCGGASDAESDSTSPGRSGPEASQLHRASGDRSGSLSEERRESGAEAAGSGPGSIKPSEKEAKAFKAPPGADNSIQTFGRKAQESQAGEVVAAMRAFMRALAAADHPSICRRLTREAAEEVRRIPAGMPSCAAALRRLMAPRRSVEGEILRAAKGVVYQVRIEGDMAYVLFTPVRGKASFFLMKRQGGEWKSAGVSSGSPLNT